MTALPFVLVFAAVLQTGCNRHGGQSAHQAVPTTDAATLNLSEEDRCAVVATILTFPLWGKVEGSPLDVATASGGARGPIVAAVETKAADGSPRPLFSQNHACSELLMIVPPKAAQTNAAISLSLDREPDASLRFALSGYKRSASGRVAKDTQGEWHVQLSGAQAKQARALDPAPVEHPLAPPLPPGIVQARFEADTGKDITDGRTPQSGLVLVVRFGAVEKRQTIASCDEVTRGDVLGDIGNDVLDIAACNTLFRLLIRKGEVLVEREPDGGGAPIIVTSLKLPAGVRSVGKSSQPKGK